MSTNAAIPDTLAPLRLIDAHGSLAREKWRWTVSFNEADARGFSEKGLSTMLRGFAGKPLITALSHNAEKIDIAPIANPVSSSSPSYIVTFFDHNALVMLVGFKKEDNEHNWIKILKQESSHQGILGEGRFKTA